MLSNLTLLAPVSPSKVLLYIRRCYVCVHDLALASNSVHFTMAITSDERYKTGMLAKSSFEQSLSCFAQAMHIEPLGWWRSCSSVIACLVVGWFLWFVDLGLALTTMSSAYAANRENTTRCATLDFVAAERMRDRIYRV